MNGAPKGGGLPPKVYVPIVLTVGIVIVAIVAIFLKSALTTQGGALAPEAPATLPPSAAPLSPVEPQNIPSGEVTIPQSGGPGATERTGPPPVVTQMLATEKAALAKNPRDLSALVQLASLYYDASMYAKAIPYYQRALAIDPDNPDTRTDYATSLHAVGNDLEALSQLQRVLDGHPTFAPALFNEGIVASAIGRRSQAIASFEKFLSVAPRDPKAADARTALKNLGAAP